MKKTHLLLLALGITLLQGCSQHVYDGNTYDTRYNTKYDTKHNTKHNTKYDNVQVFIDHTHVGDKATNTHAHNEAGEAVTDFKGLPHKKLSTVNFVLGAETACSIWDSFKTPVVGLIEGVSQKVPKPKEE